VLLLPKKPTATDVFAWCEQWLAHLEQQDFAAAYEMLMPNSQWAWTPELIEKLITNHGTLELTDGGVTIYRVTSPRTATGERYLSRLRVDPDDPVITGEVHPKYPFAVHWFRDPPLPRLGYVVLDYPLNGEWSNLTSHFDIVRRGGGLALDLERMR
jgi:hypothetical protein